MLDPQIRIMIENKINQWIRDIPERVRSARKAGRWAPNVQHEIDYGLGYSHGSIRASFIVAYTVVYNRPPNDEELQEAEKLIFSRNDDFRDAILKSG